MTHSNPLEIGNRRNKIDPFIIYVKNLSYGSNLSILQRLKIELREKKETKRNHCIKE